MEKNIAKDSVKPSVSRNSNRITNRNFDFKSTVPRDKYLSRELSMDNPDYWNSEFAYFGQTSTTVAAPAAKPWYEKLVDIYGSYQAQRTAQKLQEQLSRENLERVKLGKSPIGMDEYASYAAPQINVGLSENVRNMLIYGGIGLAGILLFTTLQRRRK